jgi:hypothetical protein
MITAWFLMPGFDGFGYTFGCGNLDVCDEPYICHINESGNVELFFVINEFVWRRGVMYQCSSPDPS